MNTFSASFVDSHWNAILLNGINCLGVVVAWKITLQAGFICSQPGPCHNKLHIMPQRWNIGCSVCFMSMHVAINLCCRRYTKKMGEINVVGWPVSLMCLKRYEASPSIICV